MLTARSVTAFFHAKSSTLTMMLLACFSTVVAWRCGAIVTSPSEFSFGFPPADQWFASEIVSVGMSLAATIVVALFIIYINRVFNILRSLTALVGTMFMAMQIALPSVLGAFGDGIMLTLLMLVCAMLLFSVFSDSQGQRPVFLAFCLLGAALFFRLSYLLYVPVLLLGCMQMRVFSLRGFLAAMLGLITPAWILFGFGIVDPRDLNIPDLSNLWDFPLTAGSVRIIVVTGFTILTGFCFMVANILKILSYNSRVRAYNGFFTMLFVFTAIFAAVNFRNITFYVPLLNCMAAYQVSHFFTYRRHRRSFIPILILILVYVGFYVWAILE